MQKLIRAACLTHYSEVARACGLDPGLMLSEAGLPRAALDNPELRIPTASVQALLERSAERSGEIAFGLLMAEGRRLSNLGVLGLLFREQPTLRLGLEVIGRYGRLHNDATAKRIDEEAGIATIYEDLLIDFAGSIRQSIELSMGVEMRVLRTFLGPNWQARSICFTHAAPADLNIHRRVLGQTPQFLCDFNGIVCASADLDTPIATADPIVAQYIRQSLSLDSRIQQSVSDEVRQMIMLLLPQGRCTIEQVARFLGVHRRTLHRQLVSEGVTFLELVQAIRRDLALRYLSERRRSLTEVSSLLGFADLSSFSRWRRRHLLRTELR